MATRKIDTQIARDNLWREMPIKVRYFWLYLLTCDFTTTIGIFHLPLNIVSTETDLTIDELKNCIETLKTKGIIDYEESTGEIVIFNYAKYNIFGWNDFMRKMVFKELGRIKSLALIDKLVAYISKYVEERPNDPRSTFLSNLIWACNKFLKPKEKDPYQKENKKKDKDNDNDYDIDNDNEKDKESIQNEIEDYLCRND